MPSPAPFPVDPSLFASLASTSTAAQHPRQARQKQRDLNVFDSTDSDGDWFSRGRGGGGGGGDDSYSPSLEADEPDELDDDDVSSGRVSKSKARITVKEGKGKGTPVKNQRRVEYALKLGGGKAGEPGHSGRKTTMSCENCRVRKMKCSRHPVCNNCRMRGEECVYLDLGPQNAARFASHQASIATNREEIARLNRLIRLLSTRYTLREAVLAKQQNREPRATPSREDAEHAALDQAERVDNTGGEDPDANARVASRHSTSPLEDAEALLALATPTVRDPPAGIARAEKEETEDLLVEPELKATQSGAERDKRSPPQKEAEPSAPKVTIESAAPLAEEAEPQARKTPSPPKGSTSAGLPQPLHPSPEVIRPFGRPTLPRSATTTDAVPALRVSIPTRIGHFPPSSRSSGHPSAHSSARLPPLSALAPPPPYHMRTHAYGGGGGGGPFMPVDAFDLVPTAEHAFPHLSPFPPLPQPPQRLPPHLRGRPPPPSPYGSIPSPHAFSPFPGGLPPPPQFPQRLPSPPRPPPPEPYFFYPTLPSPLLSPRSVADLAATKQRMRFIQNQPHVRELQRRHHEERFERALAADAARKAAQARAEVLKQQQQQKKSPPRQQNGRPDKGKRRADDLSDDEEREDEAKQLAEERQRDLARRAAASWAAFAATEAVSSSSANANNAFAAVEPYRPMAREADPMLGVVGGGGGGGFLPSAGPISAGPSSAHGGFGNRRASWLLLSPGNSHSGGSPRLSRASSRPALTLDPTTPSFSALRTPSAGPLSSLPSAGALLHSLGLPSAGGGGGGTRPYISLSPMRSAHPLHSAVEEGLRPFSSIRGVPSSFDDRFEPQLERFEPQLERRASDAFGLAGAGGAGDDWARFEPVLEERRKEEEEATSAGKAAAREGEEQGEGTRASSAAPGPKQGTQDEAQEAEEEETGWETDGKSSVGRRSTRSMSARSASGRSRGGGEDETDEDSDEE
ncbi:hypothetical protein JCM6882_003120 [Rhodosporidiobolus microsporus]